MQHDKQVGVRGKIIHAQSREIIANVIKFMKKEADRRDNIIPITSFKKRVLEATGISDKVYRQVIRDMGLIDAGLINTFHSPSRFKKEDTKKLAKIETEPSEEVVVPGEVIEIYLPCQQLEKQAEDNKYIIGVNTEERLNIGNEEMIPIVMQQKEVKTENCGEIYLPYQEFEEEQTEVNEIIVGEDTKEGLKISNEEMIPIVTQQIKLKTENCGEL